MGRRAAGDTTYADAASAREGVASSVGASTSSTASNICLRRRAVAPWCIKARARRLRSYRLVSPHGSAQPPDRLIGMHTRPQAQRVHALRAFLGVDSLTELRSTTRPGRVRQAGDVATTGAIAAWGVIRAPPGP